MVMDATDPLRLPWVAGPIPTLDAPWARWCWRRHLKWAPPFVPFSGCERYQPTTPGSRWQSMVMIAVPYGRPDYVGSGLTLSQTSWGLDYHRVVPRLLHGLLIELVGREAADRAHLQVDTGPLEERAFALALGLGRLGGNAAVVVRPYGSCVFLGLALLDVGVPIRRLVATGATCHACYRCVEACPTGALMAPHRVNAYRCLSYLTQKKGVLPRVYRRQLGGRIYGCDACTLSCPENQAEGISAFRPSPSDQAPDPAQLLQMHPTTFQKHFGEKSAGWRGRRTLQRNVLIALGNTGGPDDIESIGSQVKDRRPVIRSHALWALHRLSHRHGVFLPGRLLETIRWCANDDSDPWVRREARQLLRDG